MGAEHNKVFELFKKAGLEKVHFKPEITIKLTPHSWPSKIISIEQVGDKLIINHYKGTELFTTEINNADIRFITSVTIRLYSLTIDK